MLAQWKPSGHSGPLVSVSTGASHSNSISPQKSTQLSMSLVVVGTIVVSSVEPPSVMVASVVPVVVPVLAFASVVASLPESLIEQPSARRRANVWVILRIFRCYRHEPRRTNLASSWRWVSAKSIVSLAVSPAPSRARTTPGPNLAWVTVSPAA